MQILFLDLDVSKQDFYKAILKEIANENEIQFFSHPILLREHFKTKVIPYQLHVDLVISDVIFPSDTFQDNVDFFRLSQENYSDNNFKLSSIPIIIHTDLYDTADVKALDVDKIIPKPLNINNNTFANEVLDLVKEWRKKIYDDLEILGIGIDYDFAKSDLGYAVRVKSEQTKILSKGFLFKQQRLPYQWLNKEFFEYEASIEELENLINLYLALPKEKLQRIRWEDQLQAFFVNHPKFLFENNYLNYWSQPKLDIPESNRFYKPDFVVKPYSYGLGKNWEIIDLKLPLQEFLQKTNFHKTFTGKFFKCLKQIRDYKAYFMDDKNKAPIEKVLNFHPKFPRLTLVVGRQNLLFEQQDKIHHELNAINSADVYLLTYDEIIENQKLNLQRLLKNKL